MKGTKYAIQKWIQKKIGMFSYDEQLNSIYYFLNNYLDITQLPKAEGNLRKLQLCDEQLLAIFHEICIQNNLKYWVDYGTLLGLKRHGGFIPWDDDIDVSMMREDYEKAIRIFPEIFAKYGIDAKEEKNEPSARIGIGYKHKKTGIWMDVFPMDELSETDGSDETKCLLKKKINSYKKFYEKKKTKVSREKLSEIRDLSITGFKEGNKTLLYNAPEFLFPKIVIHNKENVFPLSTAKFESITVNVPKDIAANLTDYYGPTYMQFPKSGVEHHGSTQGKLSEWAVSNNIDMSVISEELKSILKTIKNGGSPSRNS